MYKNEDGEPLIGKIIIHVVSGLFLLSLVFGSFKIIGAGERGVVLRVGAVNRIMADGIHAKIPFFEGVEVLDVRTQKEQVPANAASKDLQTVTAAIALNYHLSPDSVGDLWSKVGSEYKTRVIDPAIQESVKAATAKYTAEELITKRELVKEDIRLSLMERLSREFIVVDDVSITDFDFSATFNAAIEAKVTAEQSALGAKNKLAQAEYEAKQRIAQATGEAEAIRIQAQAINAQGGADYVQLQAIKAWDGHLPTSMIPNATVPFINLR